MQLLEKLSKPIENTPFCCRPFCFLASVYLLALFLFKLNTVYFAVYGALVLLYAAYMILRNKKISFTANPLPYLAAGCIALSVIAAFFGAPSPVSVSNENVEIKAVIKETVYRENFGSMYFAELKEISGEKVNGNAYIEFSGEIAFSEYDTVTFDGKLNLPDSGKSIGEKLSQVSKKIVAEISADSFKSVTNESKRGVGYLIFTVREKTAGVFEENLSPTAAEYIKALIIGDKNGLSESFRSDMSDLGLSHVLAISGMHLSLLAAIIMFFADRLKTARKLKSVIILIGTFCFAAVAGFSPSVMRSAIMLGVSLLSVFAKAKSDPLTSLMISAVIICTADTGLICSCSFLLSFFATLGLVLCALYIEKISAPSLDLSRAGDMKSVFRVLRKIIYSLVVTVCASLFTVPVLSMYFSEFSFFALFVNPIAVPLVFASMVLAILLLLFSGVPVAGYVIAAAIEGIYHFFETVAAMLSDTFTTTVSLGYPTFVPCLILLFGIFVYYWRAKIRNPVAVIAAFVAVSVVFVSSVQVWQIAQEERVKVQYIAGKTSETFLLFSGGKTMLIDIGNGSKSLPELATETAKEDYYVTDISAFMMTHYHSAHIGTLKRLSMTEHIERLWLPLPENENEAVVYENIISLELGIEISIYKRGESVTFGNTVVETTVAGEVERSAHPVIALSIYSGEKRITYLGSSVTESDIYLQAEKFISGSGVLICGNHGPVNKEYAGYLTVSGQTVIYASPYNNYDTTLFFPGKAISVVPGYEEDTVRSEFSLS